MDVLEALKQDHDKLKRLFARLREADNDRQRYSVFRTIKSELELHAFVEETVFYPAFRNYDSLREKVAEGFERHARIRDSLERMSNAGAEFSSQLETLEEEALHHFGEEEDRFFAEVRRLLRRPEREALGRHLEAARHEKMEAA